MKRWMTILLTLAMLLGLLPSALAEQPPSTDTFCNSTMSGKHSWRDWKTTSEATCTKDGSRSRTCGRCGYTQTETIKKTGHKWGKWKTTKEATCQKKGEQVRACKVCGATETRKTDRADHKWGDWTVTKEATCTENGAREHKCKVCGEKESESTKKLPHSWGDWQDITPATDHSSGTRKHACQVCGAEEIEDYDPEGTLRRGAKGDAVKRLQEGLICYGVLKQGGADGAFGPGTEKAVMAAQTAEGLAADGIAWPQTLARLGHRFGEWEVLSELSDFSMGLRQRTCVRCGYVEKVEEWPEPIYRRGDRGDGVKDLQEKLNAAGYNCGAADGDFGRKTEAAVSAIEEAHGVAADGIAWPGVQKWLGPATASISAYSNGESARGLLDKLRNGPDGADETFDPLEIVVHPVGGTYDPNGEPLTLSVEVTGGKEPYSYYWYKQFTFQKGDETKTLGYWVGEDAPELPATEPGRYYCKVIDAKGDDVKSDIAEVTSEFYIARQPEDANLYGVDSVTLTCEAMGGTPFQNGTYMYAWYDANDNQIAFTDVGKVEVSAEGEYYCMVQDNGDGLLTSDVVTVYEAMPLKVTADFNRPQENQVGVYATVLGGTEPYTATWSLDGVEIGHAELNSIGDGVYEADYLVLDNGTLLSPYGTYTISVTDKIGNTETASAIIQLSIAQQPQGGMLPEDGSGLQISMVMAEGTEPFTYTLFRDGEYVSSHTGDCDFTVKNSGEYYFHIEDANGLWANSNTVFVKDYGFSIVEYTPHEVEVNAETLAFFGYPGYYLQVVTEGGREPITYKWTWQSFDGIQTVELPDTAPMAYAPWPGIYYCRAHDADNLWDEAGPMTVTATEKQIYITEEPQDIMWEYHSEGGYSGTLSCDAVTEAGTDERLTFSWWKKTGDRWILLHEYEKELTITEQGQYRCEVYYTRTGQHVYSREALVQVRMIVLRAKQVGNSAEIKLEFGGGAWPYTVTESHRFVEYRGTNHNYHLDEDWWWSYYWGWNTIASDGPTKQYFQYDSYGQSGYFAFTMKGMEKYKKYWNVAGKAVPFNMYSFTVRDAFGQTCTVSVSMSY